jgi:acyl-CoA synthetase (AMP-forming)/AMP-acid ligase II
VIAESSSRSAFEPADNQEPPVDNLTFIDCLIPHADAHAARTALQVRSYVHGTVERKTYRELVDDVLALAAVLGARYGAGARAVLVFPTSWEFVESFLACLACGIVAAPAPCDRGQVSQRRVRSIIADFRPAVVLHARGAAADLASEFPDVSFVELSGLLAEPVTGALVRQRELDAPAFVQYSSGSLATPKGVVITQRNLIANQREIRRVFRHDADSHVGSWLPHHHDMGLIGGILQPLFNGASCLLFPAQEFIQAPERWFMTVDEGRCVSSGAPNFAYAHCVNRIKGGAFDLSSWRNAFNGAEPISARVVRAFTAAFAPLGFAPDAILPCYGLAESTLLVAGGHLGRDLALCAFTTEEHGDHIRYVPADSAPGALELVPVGRLSPASPVRIVRPGSAALVDEGEVGRLWVASDSVAAGYWGKPAETAAAFANRLPYEPGTYLDTGDAAFHAGDQLFIVGRSANKLIVRGQKLYAEEVERQLAEHLPAGCTSVTALQPPMAESISLVVEVARALRADTAFAAQISEALERSMIRTFGVRPSEIRIAPELSLPRTTSGKIRREDCLALIATNPPAAAAAP